METVIFLSITSYNVQNYLERAYKNFFRNKNHFGFPKFKEKKRSKQSYTTININNYTSIKIENKYIRLPKIGMVRVKQHRSFNGTIKLCTVTKTSSNRYYISILVEEPECTKYQRNDNILGIDLGIKHFAVMSNGEIIDNPKWFRRSEKRLAKLQRDLSRKKYGSNNCNKTRIKVAKQYEKVTNQRNDFLHKLSSKIIRDNQTIVIEDLRISNMITKSHSINKSIYEVSWNKFDTMLSYKAERYGRDLIIADKQFPSSQLCHVCGYRNRDVKNLALREWTCPKCGNHHDRDFNASMNLVNYGINILEQRQLGNMI
jgi:putative transposase